MPVRDGSFNGEALIEGDQRLTSQSPPEYLDDARRKRCEIGEGSLSHSVSLSIGLPQEDGGVRTSVGNGLHVHDYSIHHIHALSIVR